MVSPIETNSTNVPAVGAADVMSDALACGDAKATQFSIWAKVKLSVVYSWSRGSTRLPADSLRDIWKYAPMPLLIKWVRTWTWGRLRISPATNPSMAELDIDGRAGLTLGDVAAGLMNIDQHKLDAQLALAEDASLERQLSAARDANEKIRRESWLNDFRMNHPELKRCN